MGSRLIDATLHKDFIDDLLGLIQRFDSLPEADPSKNISVRYCTFEDLVKYCVTSTT